MIGKFFFYFRKIFFFIRFRRKFAHLPWSSFINNPLSLEGLEFVVLGERTFIHSFAWIGCYRIKSSINEPRLEIRNDVGIGNFCHISCVSEILIEDSVLIAEKVTIADSTHCYLDINTPIKDQNYDVLRPVRIGRGSWIGDNCCILGASIGKHCVIGAGSTVTRNIPDYSVAAGNPARIIKRYNFKTKEWIKV